MAEHFKSAYPWVKYPVITNGPMAIVAGPEMVTEVTRAGGLGFMAAGKDIKEAEKNLKTAQHILTDKLLPNGHMPIGLGVLCFAIQLDDFVRLVKEYKPVAVWLFAAHNNKDYDAWAQAVRSVSEAKVWIQSNSVAEAVVLAQTVKPDVLVMQGSDAGGHGAEKAAGIVSLIPETVDALDIPVIAAGGIADGRGVAAAVTLGALGATMGTRFLACKEAVMPNEAYLKAVLAAKDGGQSTIKHKVFDDMNATGNIWPISYDGRGLRNATSEDHGKGVNVEANRKLFADGAESNDGFAATMEESRANAWAGTAVGLVKSVDSAYDIVQSSRADAIKILQSYRPMFD